MALHCGGRVPVSWLSQRALRPGGGKCACEGGCKQKGQEGVGVKRTGAGRGGLALTGSAEMSWRSTAEGGSP